MALSLRCLALLKYSPKYKEMNIMNCNLILTKQYMQRSLLFRSSTIYNKSQCYSKHSIYSGSSLSLPLTFRA